MGTKSNNFDVMSLQFVAFLLAGIFGNFKLIPQGKNGKDFYRSVGGTQHQQKNHARSGLNAGLIREGRKIPKK